MRLPFRPIIASIEKELSHGFDASVTDLADEAGCILVGGDCWLIRVTGLCVTSMRTMVRVGQRAW